MTLKEVEEFYKIHNGLSFQMGRDDETRYHAYKAMNLPESTLAQWDAELLDLNFNRMKEEPANAWIQIGRVIEILMRGRLDTEKEVARLLDEMDKMTDLSLETRTLILGDMSGRDCHLKTGGVYLICTKTKQSKRMKEVIQHITGTAPAAKTQAADKYISPGSVPSRLSVDAWDDEQYFKLAEQKYHTALSRFDKG